MKTLLALGLWAAGCIGAAAIVSCSGPGQLNPKTQRAAYVFACYVHALAPYLPEAIDAAEAVKGSLEGETELGTLLVRLGHSAEDIAVVAAAFNACVAQPIKATKPDRGVVLLGT